MTLNPWFSLGYLVLATALVSLELIGIHRKAKDGDTITENWHWVEKHLHGPLQWLWRVLTLGFLTWIMFHFGGHF